MMNSVMRAAIYVTYDCCHVFGEIIGVHEYIPIWDELTEEQQWEALEYVKKNENNEDFGNSGCCKAIHQATAYYCMVQLLEHSEAGDYFDDLDFRMAETLRNNSGIKKMLGVSENF
tara:strand:- start:5279 stop:5626 length:348 start_codon:yes stop_codon:yes gene_type:complete